MDDELAGLGPMAALLFAGLWTLADREGRLADRPARIKACILPYYDCDIDALLDTLSPHFIERYEVDGTSLIQVSNFSRHQCPNVKEPASTIPAPCQHDTGTSLIGREGKEGKGTEGKGNGGENTPPLGDIAEVGSAYERLTGQTLPASSFVALCAAHPTDRLIEAVRVASEKGKATPAYIGGIARSLAVEGWKPEPVITDTPNPFYGLCGEAS